MRKSVDNDKKLLDLNATQGTPKGEGIIRFRVGGELVEFTPTPDSPNLLVSAGRYDSWLNSISDVSTNARITLDVAKMRRGLFGDWKEVGDGLFEMRLAFGPVYRIYYGRFGRMLTILLGGGDKSSQSKDIAQAAALWKELKNEIQQI